MQGLQDGYRQSDRHALEPCSMAVITHGCSALIINLDQRCCHHRGDNQTLHDVTNNMGNQRYYVCSTGGQRAPHVLIHQVAIATAHLGGLPHITVLPLLGRRGSQWRRHIVGTCPIVLQCKCLCGKPCFGVAARQCTSSQSCHPMQSLNSLAKASAVHIQTPSF